jgi:Ca2+-binding EF-hand superfamily protein
MRLFAVVALLGLGLFGLSVVDGAVAPPVPVTEADDVQDILYLGRPYPVLIRLHVRSNGMSAFARWERFMDKLFAHLDRNKSGGLDRVEARAAPNPQQIQQLFAGNLFISPSPRRVVPFEQLDADRDGKVTVDELKAYYTKNGAGPVLIQQSIAAFNRSARVQAAPALLGNADPGTDVLFTILDTNNDGKLSKEELLAAERVLMRYDANDDELISPQELGVPNGDPRTRLALDALARANARAAVRQSALILVPRDEGRRAAGRLALAREMISRFDTDKDDMLSREEIGFPQELFDRLDRNKDGKLDALELARWTQERPAAEFVINLGIARRAMMPARPPVARPAVGKRDSSMTLLLDSVQIDVVPQSGGVRVPNDRNILSLFNQADIQRKGFITRKQVERQPFLALRGLFDLADINVDGRLSREELKSYLELMREAAGAQVSLALVSTGKGLFQALDANGDGRLSIREMRNAWARLAQFDRDGDGCISRTEFPQQFRLIVSDSASNAPGRALAPALRFNLQPQSPPRSTRGPLWFRKMDRNGDGDVSPREWLGTADQFRAIDTDGDGLISVEEAEAYDALMRKKGN